MVPASRPAPRAHPPRPLLLADLTGGTPDYGYVLRLGIIAVILVAAPFALYVLHRSNTTRGEAGRRTAALLVMAIFVVVMPVTVSGWSAAAAAEAPTFVVITLLAIWLTYIGFGSIAGWAFRFAWVQLGALGTRRVLHRWPLRVLPGPRHHRDPRRRRGAVVRRAVLRSG